MSEMEKILEKLRREARQRTLERLSKHGRNVNILLFTLISEVYALETTLEELLLALEELYKKGGKKKKHVVRKA